MTRTKAFGRAALTLTLMMMLTACTRSADRMSGAALPQEAPPAAAEVDAAVPASDTLGVAPDASAAAAAGAVPASEATGASEADNPWGALAVPADQAAAAAEAARAFSEPGTAADAAAPAADAASARPAGLPVAGSPSACQTLLKPIDDALKAGGSLILAITIVPANGAYVSYAEGEVKRVPKLVPAGSPAKTALEGTMWQQFSDRVAPDDGLIVKCAGPCPTPNGPPLPKGPQRFVKDRLDKLGVSVDVATGGTTLILYSWNNAVVRLTPTCEQGMFYGYSDGKLYAMTGRLTRPIPTVRPPIIVP